jgi:hypothetical protein
MMATPTATAPRSTHASLLAAALSVAICVSVLVGALVAHGGAIVAFLLLATPLAVWLALVHPGFTLGGLWLAALNGIPFINTESSGGQLRVTDVVIIVIVLMAIAHWLLSPSPTQPFPTVLALACGLLGAWWCLTFARSLYAGIPALNAFLLDRDFLSLVIVIPGAWILLSTPTAWRECVAVVLVGTGVYALAFVAGTLGFANTASLTHPEHIVSLGGITRLYTSMNDLVVAVAVFGAAALLTTRKSRATPWIGVVTAITLGAFLLQLTRAAYFGMAIGALIGFAVALTRGVHVRQVLLRRATIALVALVIMLFALIGVASSSVQTSIVSQRVLSGFSALADKSGTVGYRLTLYDRMLEVLGHDWPVGLGFIHPSDRYFPSLPRGEIRNADVGLMNAVMTMGVIGLVLLYGVLIAVARYVARTRSRRQSWLVVGLFGWLAVVFAGSPTLVTLFSSTGLISTALTLVICGVMYGRSTCLDAPTSPVRGPSHNEFAESVDIRA